MSDAKSPPGDRFEPSRRFIQRELDLGIAQRSRGDLDAASRTLRGALVAARETDDRRLLAVAMRELGLTMLAASRLREADELLDHTLREVMDLYGEEGPQWVTASEDLALARRARGDLSGALRLQRGAYETSRRAFGEQSPLTFLVALNLVTTTNLNRVLILPTEAIARSAQTSSRLLRAAALQIDSAEGRLGPIGSDDFEASLKRVQRAFETSADARPFAMRIDALLTESLTRRQDPRVAPYAVELAERVLARSRSELGERHPQTLSSLQLVSRALAHRDADLAVQVGREAAVESASVLGRGHVDTLGAFENLATLLAGAGDDRGASDLRQENLRIRAADEGIFGEEQPPIENLAGTLTGSIEQVEPEPETFIAGLRAPAPEAGSASVSQAEEVVRRTAHAELSTARPIEPGERFEVWVWVDRALADDAGSGEVKLKVRPGTTLVCLDAWLVVSRHFEIEGDAVLPLRLDLRKATSRRVSFAVREVHGGELVESDPDPEVRVFFSYEGWPCGEVSLTVPLAHVAEEAAP